MKYLGIRTDTPLCEMYLYEDVVLLSKDEWQADRELAKLLLGKIEAFLATNNTAFKDLGGVFAFRGPGSFTGLRIGLTVINTVAYAEQLPVVRAQGETWRDDAVSRLLAGETDEMILPLYGADPRITLPKK